MRVKLSVEKQTTTLGRLCKITEWGTYPEPVNIQTPGYLTYTRFGHIPNITWDVYRNEMKLKQRQIFQLTLGSFFDALEIIEKCSKDGIKQFCSMPNDSILHLTPHDSLKKIPSGFNNNKTMALWAKAGRRSFCSMPNDSILHLTPHDSLKKIPSGFNNNKTMALWAKAGRRSIDAKSYKNILEVCKVHSFICLNDYDTPKNCKPKRLGKSLFRTSEWNNEMYGKDDVNEAGFIVLNGGFSKQQRISNLKHFLPMNYSKSFSIDMMHFSQGNVDNKIDFDKEEIEELITDVVKELPSESPRLIEGAFNPQQILTFIKLGIDLFDSSYAILLADDCKAFKIGKEFINNGEFEILNIGDEIYKEDMSKLFDDCDCHTCKTFQKAYLRHLSETKEMLLPVLLTIHNLTEFDRIRKKRMDDIKLDRRYDWVGPPDKLSKIRPIKLRRVDNETEYEENYRKNREKLAEWNSNFWSKHNELFDKKKEEFRKEKKKELGRLGQITPADMSIFYKQFLNERAASLREYNNEWYRKNFSLLGPAIRVNWIRFRRLFKR
uniref:tRNA-guanine(15) transglycosylase-like domain-containing protein n=2 Tax=Panagrolaimus sp. JU765 TaxID=591449 RepID=A0AC34QWE2_9BILA